MKILYWKLLLIISLLINNVSYTQNTLIVSAAISLKEALAEIAALYHTENPSTTILVNLGGSGALRQQIENGANADIFIAASPLHVDMLYKKGLLLEAPISLLNNRLVAVSPIKSPFKPGDFSQILQNKTIKKLALGEPKSVPAGAYAAETLAYFKLADTLKSTFIYGKDVREVLSWVQSGNVDIGLVYYSDAKNSPQVKILAEAPKESHSPIIYPLALIKKSRNIDEAKKLAAYLRSKKALDIFTKYGFSPYQP